MRFLGTSTLFNLKVPKSSHHWKSPGTLVYSPEPFWLANGSSIRVNLFSLYNFLFFLETDAITEWKGGNGGSRATSIWVKPDSCCGSKPYNSGDKSCCGGTHVFDFMTEYCEGGQVFKNNQF
jgi:hypothetical protein